MRNQFKAFSLIEMLIVIALIGVLAAITIPNWFAYQKKIQADLAGTTPKHAIETTQSLAILRHQIVSLCPSDDQHHCQSAWRNFILIFTNPLQRDQPETPAAIIEVVPLILHQSVIQWRHFSLNPSLNFSPSGQLLHDNGTFHYCQQDADVHFTRAFTLNIQGRFKELTERNSMGQLIDHNNQVISCP